MLTASCVPQRRLVHRVTSSRVSWDVVKKQWEREAFFRAVDPFTAETLFTRHLAKLQQDEAADARARAAEVRISVTVSIAMHHSGFVLVTSSFSCGSLVVLVRDSQDMRLGLYDPSGPRVNRLTSSNRTRNKTLV
jgi:hypothetical protein